MHMEHIQVLGTRDLGHFHRKRQCVVGTRKQRIVRKFNLMKLKPLLRQVQSNRLSVTKQKHFMPAASQFRAEGSSQNTTASDEWKTCDPYFQPLFHYSSVYDLSKSEISSRLMN